MYQGLRKLFAVTSPLGNLRRLTISADDDLDTGDTGAGTDGAENNQDRDDQRTDDAARTGENKSYRFKNLAEADEGYRQVQSEKDRIATQNANLSLELQQARAEMQRIKGAVTGDRSSGESDLNKRARDLARETQDKIKALDPKAPNYAEEVYATIYEQVLASVPKVAEQTSRQVMSEEDLREARREASERTAVTELEAQGLDASFLQEVKMRARWLQQEDPGWFQRVPDKEQIKELVSAVKERYRPGETMTTEDDKQEDGAAEERRPAKPRTMAAVLGRGTTRSGGTGTRARGNEEGPGSFLADLQRFRKDKRDLGTTMFNRSMGFGEPNGRQR